MKNWEHKREEEIPHEFFTHFVPGYNQCPECGINPSFAYDSAKPDIITVITCDHITEKAKA